VTPGSHRYIELMRLLNRDCYIFDVDSQTRPKIVCYCGSRKFIEAFKDAEYESVLNREIALFPTFMHETTSFNGAQLRSSEYRQMADELHKRKIDICDEVFVINVNGYIGPSTRNEIDYALLKGKSVKFLHSDYIYEI